MADIRSSQPGVFSCDDIPEPITLTVKTARQQEIGPQNKRETKLVLVFEGTERVLVLNQTRTKQLGALVKPGADIAGTKVLLEVSVENVNGRDFTMICIRDPEAVA
jgi:hypothetical protein